MTAIHKFRAANQSKAYAFLLMSGLALAIYAFFSTLLGLGEVAATVFALIMAVPAGLFFSLDNKPTLTKRHKFVMASALVILGAVIAYIFTYIFMAPKHSSIFMAITLCGLWFLALSEENTAIKTRIKYWDGFLFLLAVLAVLISVQCVLLLTNQMLTHDEWRHYDDYFFRYDLAESIVKRQNGHLMLLPNFILRVNYAFGEGRHIFLSAISAGLIFGTGWIASLGLKKANLLPEKALSARTIQLSLVAITFSFTGFASLFWGLGLHNNLGVFFGIAGAYASSGLMDDINKPKTIAVFSILAFCGAASFSAAAAIWFLGLAGAIAQRAPLKTVLIYASIAIIGFMATLGYATLSSSRDVEMNIPNLISALIGLLGLPFGNFVRAVFSGDNGFVYKTGVIMGAIGFIFFLAVSVVVLIKRPKSLKGSGEPSVSHALTFGWLICLFGIGACGLVAVGRMGWYAHPEQIMFPRFGPWALSFWLGLSLALLVAVSSRKNLRESLTPKVSVLLILGMLVSNTMILGNSTIYVHNYRLRHIMDTIVNADEGGAVATIWREKNYDAVTKVNADLKRKSLNIYADEWPYIDGKKLSDVSGDVLDMCVGRISLRSYEKTSTDFIIDGWARRLDKKGYLSTLVALNEEGIIMGIARPRFGNRNGVDPLERAHRPFFAKAVRVLPFPYNKFPGASGYFHGIVSMPDTSTDKPQLAYAAQTVSGKWCRVDIR